MTSEVGDEITASIFFFSSRRRHTKSDRDWSSDVCSSDLADELLVGGGQLAELVGRDLGIGAGAQPALDRVQVLVEDLPADAEHDVAEHRDEAAGAGPSGSGGSPPGPPAPPPPVVSPQGWDRTPHSPPRHPG